MAFTCCVVGRGLWSRVSGSAVGLFFVGLVVVVGSGCGVSGGGLEVVSVPVVGLVEDPVSGEVVCWAGVVSDGVGVTAGHCTWVEPLFAVVGGELVEVGAERDPRFERGSVNPRASMERLVFDVAVVRGPLGDWGPGVEVVEPVVGERLAVLGSDGPVGWLVVMDIEACEHPGGGLRDGGVVCVDGEGWLPAPGDSGRPVVSVSGLVGVVSHRATWTGQDLWVVVGP